MYTKYNIQDCNFYNFNKTGFIMKVICNNIVVIRIDRFDRDKQL